jgi:hypothetical protein
MPPSACERRTCCSRQLDTAVGVVCTAVLWALANPADGLTTETVGEVLTGSMRSQKPTLRAVP